MIQYKFSRVQPYLNEQNLVTGFVIGMTATDNETNITSYIDKVKNLEEPYKSLDEWTIDEIRNLCLEVAAENDWYNILAKQIETQKTTPKLGNNIII